MDGITKVPGVLRRHVTTMSSVVEFLSWVCKLSWNYMSPFAAVFHHKALLIFRFVSKLTN